MLKFAGVTVLSGCLWLGASAWDVAAADNKAATPHDIMTKINKGRNCLHLKVGSSLKQDKVDWPAVQKITKEYSDLAADLGKNDPPKGDKSSWEKLTTAYAE